MVMFLAAGGHPGRALRGLGHRRLRGRRAAPLRHAAVAPRRARHRRPPRLHLDLPGLRPRLRDDWRRPINSRRSWRPRSTSTPSRSSSSGTRRRRRWRCSSCSWSARSPTSAGRCRRDGDRPARGRAGKRGAQRSSTSCSSSPRRSRCFRSPGWPPSRSGRTSR
jgi:hypothetical protein